MADSAVAAEMLLRRFILNASPIRTGRRERAPSGTARRADLPPTDGRIAARGVFKIALKILQNVSRPHRDIR
jgi:hypothetical protein